MMSSSQPPAEAGESSPPRKKLPKKNLAEAMRDVEIYREELDQMEDYCSDRCHTILKSISNMHWSYYQNRKDIGDKLADLKYPGQLVKMLRIYNKEGVFRDDNVWFPTYYCLNIIWNFTDVSPKLCKEMVISGILDIVGANLSHEPYLDNQSSKNVSRLLKASLSILHNITKSARELPEYAKAVDKFKIKETLQKHYLTSEIAFSKCVATMVITSIISEEENKMLEDSGAIPFIISTLKSAIHSAKRRYRGFSPLELVECLSRIAMNDKNKDKIVEEGTLALLVNMMEFSDTDENAVAARTIWILSFKKDIREKIKAENGLLDALNKLKDSEDKRTKLSAEGALWMIHEKQYDEIKNGTAVSKKHIFISYDWGNQLMVKKINARLKEAGYRTWVDFEQMSGSTLEAMSQAVENAAVVLICVSERYKQSPNCRTEAEYTFQLKKDIIPLMMQRHYKPDGWLGMLIGAKFYINFDGKYEFDYAMDLLLKELNGRGKDDSSTTNSAAAQINSVAASNVTSANPSSTKSNFRSWSEKEVQEFFDSAGLTSIKNHFMGFNGEMLADLKSIKVDAPDFFYHYLEEKMNLDLTLIVKFIGALKTL